MIKWFLFVLITGVWCESDYYVVGPLFSTFPCKDSNDITIWFEAGLQQKDNNRYYVYVGKTLPADSKMTVIFDSPVNLTLTIKTDQYLRVSLTRSTGYAFYFYAPHAGMGFIIKGTEPGVTPYLTSLSINNEEYCNEPKQGFLEQFAARSIVKNTGVCGKRAIDHSELIVNGAATKPGDWPWHAAIYRLDGSTMKYICGGTLISKNYVLTAAHCVSYRGAKYRKEIFSVVLGKYKLFGDNKESEEKQILEIIIHERFEYRHLYNDIALLKLKTEVVFNDYIQPACLLRTDDRKKLSTDLMNGTIVGWGYDSTDALSQTLRQATMPIVAEATCLRTNSYYLEVLSENSFCAGYHNGTSACNGDSGSAFQVFIPSDYPDNTKNLTGTWHVKGIVSNTMARSDRSICDPDEYVVFTDVEKFVDWIEKYLEE
ncbi:chymotrypsin-C-like [Pararge aegeria]|uniref:chymotrypsin-C-like n=1 Tax=Pararge aegeria TaxID=116150 RepID=UPI0019D1D43F|nr:chymotrypsin-C-like [Pararge aegeria]XP_039747713.1 chymotrypsin-C-like [Pararge aegeria]